MAEYAVLKNAPIIEALIDIRIRMKDDLRVEHFDTLANLISTEYPEKKKRHRWEGKMEFKKGEQPLSDIAETIDGYIFTSTDKKNVLQARLDGFTFSRLKPYETWDRFRDEAQWSWKKYSEITSPEITRVAVRFINKLEIPLPLRDFSDYLTASPSVPTGLPQSVSGFLTRIVIHEPSIDAAAIITQTLEQIVNTDILPIFLDIDAFKQKPEGISEEEAWQLLEQLRNFKNKIFFESITEKAKELFL